MIAEGYGGRSSRHYSINSCWAIAGAMVNDVPEIARPGWSKSNGRWYWAPWGEFKPNGTSNTRLLRCGMCRRQIWPVGAGERQCRCDFEGVRSG